MKKKGLGRGLEALIDKTPEPETSAGTPLQVRVEAIEFNPRQPRKLINDKDLAALSESIRDYGVLEPLVVRPSDDGHYVLIAGERRLRAARAAGIERVPVIVRDATPSEMLELALIENLHRKDLNPLEEAESYQRLVKDFERTQDQIARMAGKDRSTVANLLRLLNLPPAVQDDVRHGRLSQGHARALLGLTEAEQILKIREFVLARSLSVRETEALVRKMLKQATVKKKLDENEIYYQALSENMSRALGAKVRVIHRGRKRIEIRFATHAELERLMRQFGVGPV